jgi:mannosyltransferase
MPTTRARPAAIAVALALAAAALLLLRAGMLDTGYWIDEAISVGIASHPLTEIPGALRQDGSPPLYYLLLHEWMAVVGTGEEETRALSLLFAALTVPAAWWAGSAYGRRAGGIAAAVAALCPFLTYYAQETRMYSLAALLGVLAAGAFAMDRRRLLAATLILLLYTHTWGVFVVAAMVLVRPRNGWVWPVVALAYLPWLPTLIGQAGSTGAPWAERPGLVWPALAALILVAHRGTATREGVAAHDGGRAPEGGAVRGGGREIARVAAAALALAWLASQIQPAWSTRYLAVLAGPLLLALAAHPRRALLAPAVLLAIALTFTPPASKSNARDVAATATRSLRPGDLVVSTQPEQAPVLDLYLPAGMVYLTPLGIVPDPTMTDWRDGVRRIRGGQAERRLLPVVDRLAPGRRILLVTPIPARHPSQAPWSRQIRIRTREWRAALRADPRLKPLPDVYTEIPRAHNRLRAELFEVSPETTEVRG